MVQVKNHKSKLQLNMSNYYSFGERATALIGVSLDSRGYIFPFARTRSSLASPMSDWFSATARQASANQEFTFELTDPYFGMFNVEPAGWIKSYEMNRAHFLGYPEPFGSDEMIYDTQRSATVKANRRFTCTYLGNGKVAFVDGQKSVYETIDITTLDDAATNYTGRILIAVRVTAANFEDKCVSLVFGGGLTFSGKTQSGQAFNQGTFWLNKRTEAP